MSLEEQALVWLEKRTQERASRMEEITRSVRIALHSGKRFRVSIEYLDTQELRYLRMGEEDDRTITIPSGPPKEKI